jgi:hypothetical protein
MTEQSKREQIGSESERKETYCSLPSRLPVKPAVRSPQRLPHPSEEGDESARPERAALGSFELALDGEPVVRGEGEESFRMEGGRGEMDGTGGESEEVNGSSDEG